MNLNTNLSQTIITTMNTTFMGETLHIPRSFDNIFIAVIVILGSIALVYLLYFIIKNWRRPRRGALYGPDYPPANVVLRI